MRIFSIALLCTLTLCSCTTENWYRGSKASHDASCLQLPNDEYEDCKKENDIDYETYTKKRNEINDR